VIPHYQIPRNTLLWLFTTQILVLFPHITRTPWWVIVLLGLCIIWRLQVFRGRWNFPRKIIKVGLLFAAIIGLVLSFPSFFGLEALVSVLLVAYGLKLLEMFQKRDGLILLYLSFFLIMTSFLFEQSIWLALFNLLVIAVVLTALSGLYQEQGHAFPGHSFRKSAVMVMQAIPLMVLMFVVLPRLPSFWNIPLQKNTPKTGMSDSMSPGDFGRLTQSNEPVMRITFNGASPLSKDLYWRGLVFSQFDGRRWEGSESAWGRSGGHLAGVRHEGDKKEFLRKLSAVGLRESTDQNQPRVDYEVILEASQNPWLYALQNSIPDTKDIWVTYDHLFMKHGPVTQRYKYDAYSYPSLLSSAALPDWQRKNQLALPAASNPVAADKARRWRQESASDEAYIQRLMDWFHAEFYYTLEPPTLGIHTVDEFLFETKKGFCEHFASSFVFMMRAAGIPARVVVGYQGGEWNPLEQYYLVRQYDAHAWAEVWLEGSNGKGVWKRFDPTFAVAPQRILDGFRDMFEDRGELDLPLLSLERYRDISFLNALRLNWETLNYHWARWVLGYDAERQLSFLTRLLGEYSVARLLFFSGLFIALLMGSLYGALWWQERDKTPDPVLRAYRRLCKRMGKRGIPPLAGETPDAYLLRVSQQAPERYAYLGDVRDRLYTYWYGGVVTSKADITELCRMLQR
jgi:transglutaminase-like putative cysteine protease